MPGFAILGGLTRITNEERTMAWNKGSLQDIIVKASI